MLVSNDKTVADYVTENIKAAHVFKKHGIDFCCGGAISIEKACEKNNVDQTILEKELSEIDKIVDTMKDFDNWGLDFLMVYIENIHHTYVRESLPLISQYANKVAKVHGHHYEEVVKVNKLFHEVANELISHMQKEEQVLFPFIKQLIDAKKGNRVYEKPPFGTVNNPIRMMENEHENAGNTLKEISRLTNNYTPPADACNTYWVISFATNNTFFAYKVDENGVDINNPVVSNINGLFANDPRGYLKVSPDGTKLVLANMREGAFLFDFDDVTGKVSNFNNEATPQSLNTNFENAYGVEFSTSSRRLYLSTGEFNGANENLFQYDITQPTLTDVNTSRYTVHTYFNTRGALQLGPDSKIYWTSDKSTKISVVNNPEELGAACNYSHQSVDLGGAFATQGLPPFLSSLLLPIEITDTTTGKILNNQTEQNCVGEDLSVSPEDVVAQAGSVITYEWFYNTNTTPIFTTKDLNLTNLAVSNAGDYKLKVSLTDVCGDTTILEGIFKLEVYEATSAAQPTNVFFCDIDNDGFNTFDLQNDVTPKVLNGQDPAVFEVKYFLSQTDADANINELTNPYTNPTAFNNQTIYARMHNITAPNACYDIKKFTLAVTGNPTPQTPTNYEQCDDTSIGTDTDGFISTFLLNTKDAEILGPLDPAVYEISYHTTLSGAETDKNTDVIDKNIPYSNTSVNSQLIYVRVENINNTACNDTSKSFNLIVDPLPVIANNIVTLRQCDTDADLITTVNLTLAEKSISTNYTNETYKYYPTENDAINNTAEIINQTAHPVTNGDTLWVRTISNKTCYRISRIEIVVGFASDVAYTEEFAVCDDFLDVDGNDTINNNDTDGITYFDLSSVETDIKATFPVANRPNLEVLIFETIADRDAITNNIINTSNYRNTNVPALTSQSLYVKIIDKTNNDCQGLGSFTILAQQPPVNNKVLDFNLVRFIKIF